MPNNLEFLHFDIFSAIILAGSVQGLFLFLLLITKQQKQPYHNLILAIVVLSCSLILFEIFLGYSGLMYRALFLVDYSEPLIFAIGPLIFLLVRSMGGEQYRRVEWLHFLPFIFYFFYHMPFMLENDDVKLNAFLWAFHPEREPIDAVHKFPFDPLHIRRNLTVVALIHFILYLFLTVYKGKKLRESAHINPYFLSWVKALSISLFVVVMLYLAVKSSFENDLGDHFLASFLTLLLFFISYKMLTDSGFFQPPAQLKYEKSTLTDESKLAILNKLQELELTGFFLEPSISLSGLAKRLNTSPHYLSQVLNESIGKSFFEYIGQLRITKAQELLLDQKTRHLKIDEIAERSGYLSKSAFSAAFKKLTGTTPGEFRKTGESSGATL
ncbi:AraC-like DNA-binding protein [Algoriphagus sp. 4150]|uniref:helix-turn-helix domain-containing protein n=1 Tax=Algoriphagus sp. 4150 TaxID=2817756 RepID=UPI0028653B69|nr:helix-turn-helix transcriptional regulator [Algoriphagus sp. 4150]MDR7131855.1 AraC-like DNA-binding protein [Algoriphagus sp. 4150]